MEKELPPSPFSEHREVEIHVSTTGPAFMGVAADGLHVIRARPSTYSTLRLKFVNTSRQQLSLLQTTTSYASLSTTLIYLRSRKTIGVDLPTVRVVGVCLGLKVSPAGCHGAVLTDNQGLHPL